MKKKQDKKNESSSFKKQLISGGVYIALAAAIVTVTMGSVSKIMNGDVGFVAPEIELDSKLDSSEIILPQLDFESDSPASVNPDGVKATVKERNDKTDEDKKEKSSVESDASPKSDKDLSAEQSDNPPQAHTPDSNQKQADSPSQETPTTDGKSQELPESKSNETANGYHQITDGYVSREFSMQELIYSPTMKDFRTHDGIDITGEPGSGVRAFADGAVVEVKDDELMGKTVVIDHGNGITAYYMNLSESLPQTIKAGAKIKSGDIIGGIGATSSIECADASHVHLTIRRDGVLIDPYKLLNG